jgi:hypothetical protein
MIRIRILLISIAIAIAVGGAFAGKSRCAACEYSPQYYYTGSNYVYAGTFGENYYCWNYQYVCTYYKPNPVLQPNYYAPCRTGFFEEIPE